VKNINQDHHYQFPFSGNVRAKQSAQFLGIAQSTFWLWVKTGKIKKPKKHGARVSVWDATYIRELAKNGIGEGCCDE